MSRSLFIANRRAVSEMLSYALVLIIVIGLSIGVYAYLKLQTPKAREVCGTDVLLVVDPNDAQCVIDGTTSEIKLNFVLENRGKKSISGAYIRIGYENTKIRSLVNSPDIFFKIDPSRQSASLIPGTSLRYTRTLSESEFPSIKEGNNIIEIQPVIGEGTNTLICEQSIVTYKIICTKNQK